MQTRIPQARWREFLAGYGREHHGWLTHLVEIERGAAHEHVLWHDAALLRLELERNPAGDAIAIAGNAPDGWQRIRIEGVVDVAEQRTLKGAHSGLELRTATGTRARLRFRMPAMPEAVNGLADSER